ncbi:MAG: hypothetical protein QS98_C0010G0002 [archaeon GW2011_AR3]|nr:MAG: hypothetical protein QS98_C0010G0002 [archaeon GW2011_AR3]MBS3110144.1 hypothetical protein [Candidatus Woesearchaeota archaeon]
MAIISAAELLDMLVMTLFVGFIFKDAFHARPKKRDVLEYYTGKRSRYWDGFYFAILATVPGIVLHELGHKFVALSFGMNAVFHAAYQWLGLGLILKLLNFGFIFFVPAFVSISGIGSPMQYAIVAFAGPGINLVLWLISYIVVKFDLVDKKYMEIAVLSRKINLFLFFFNLIPIRPFDGYGVFSNLYAAFVG